MPPAEVLDLLRAAQKRQTASNRWLYDPPGRWDRTLDQLYAWQALCRSVNNIVLRRLGQCPPPEVEKLDNLIRRGQDAVNELRRVLPHYIAHLHKEAEREPNALLFVAGDSPSLEREWRGRQAQEIQAYSHMFSCIIDLEPTNPQHRRRAIWRNLLSWKTHAVETYELFEQFMGKASPARNGPAVHFVRSVLTRAGIHKDERAIEQMLRRHKKSVLKK